MTRRKNYTVEAAKFNPEETGQVIQRIEQGRIHNCGGGDKRIYAKHREKVRRVTVDEMKRLVKEVYAVHGGKDRDVAGGRSGRKMAR